MAMRIKSYQSSQRSGALPAVSVGPLAGDSAAFGGNDKSPAAMQRFAQAAVDLGDAAVKARENELALQLIKAEQEDRSAWERFRGEIFTPSGTPDTGLSPGWEPPSLPQQAEEFWDRLAGERMAALGQQHPTAERYIVNTWWPMRENAVAQATEHAALQDRARRDALFATELDSAAPILANPDTPPETRQALHTELARKTRGIFANANPPQLAELEAFQTQQESAAREARARNHRDGVFAELSALPETEAQARLASPEGRKALALSEGDAEAMRGMLRAKSVFDAQQEQERKNAYSAQLAAKISGLFKSGSAAGREGPDGQAEEGAEAREPAPLAAYSLMLGADIAPHVRDAALARIMDGSFGKTDDAEAKAALVFGLAAGTLAEHAVDEAMLCGALTPGTADGLRELGKSLRGENGIYVAQGFAALHAQLPTGTAPEQQAKAQEFLQRQLAQAAESGRVPEALDPKNPANAVAVSLLLAGAAPGSAPSGPEELARDVADTRTVLAARHAPLDDSGAYRVAGPAVAPAQEKDSPQGGDESQWRAMPDTSGRSAPRRPQRDFFTTLEAECKKSKAEQAANPGLGDAYSDGLQDSVIALAVFGKESGKLTPEQRAALPWLHRMARSMGTITGDLPLYGAGAAIGAPGGPLTASAGAFGFAEGLRSVYLDQIRNGKVKDINDFLTRSFVIMGDTTKGMVKGGATALGGQAGSLAAKGLGAGGKAVGAFAGESAALTSVAAALEGRFPSAQEFADNSALILGLKVAGTGVRISKEALADRLITFAKEAGVRPEAVTQAAQKDISVVGYLQSLKGPMPEALAQEVQKTTIYNDSRSLKVTLPKTAVEASVSDRSQLGIYLKSMQGENWVELRNQDPEAYMSKLKGIVGTLFPEGGALQFRGKEGGGLDYEHLLTDEMRSMYIHTLPRTLKNHDISVEFTTEEGVNKAYLIKKYFNPTVQKDVWDILVFHNLELKTKIARSSQKGRRYVESIITQEADKSPSKSGK